MINSLPDNQVKNAKEKWKKWDNLGANFEGAHSDRYAARQVTNWNGGEWGRGYLLFGQSVVKQLLDWRPYLSKRICLTWRARHDQSSLPHFILGSRNSHIHAGTARNCTLQGGLRQLVLGRPFSTVVYDQDKSIKEKWPAYGVLVT